MLPIIREFESPLLYRNGMRSSLAGAVDLGNVERVEVLKEPASILYGAMIGKRRGQDLPRFDRRVETVDPLHFGTFGGTATRAIWLVTKLLFCGGIVTGLVRFGLR